MRGERERGLLLINISQAGQILKMKCLHIAFPPPPKHPAGHFDYCRKAVVPPPISPTQSFAFFSLLALFRIFQFILSHLLFTCFFSPLLYIPPLCFLPPLSSPQWHREAHLNAQPVMSSLPAALGNFLKCRLFILLV